MACNGASEACVLLADPVAAPKHHGSEGRIGPECQTLLSVARLLLLLHSCF